MPLCDSKAGNKPAMKQQTLFAAAAAFLSICAAALPAQDDLIAFGREGYALKRTVIDANLPGAYQVELADVNGDGRLDVVALGGGTVAWYENPTWQKRIVSDGKTSPGVISTATADIDGDGKAEVAIAYEFEMNQPKRGKLLLARQAADGWKYELMGDFPSIHRLRWGDFNGDKKPDLAIAPIFGADATPPAFQQQGAPLTVLFSGRLAEKSEIKQNRVMHAIGVVPWQGQESKSEILSASNEGVWRHRFVDNAWVSTKLLVGASGEAPKVGASEIHRGKFADGRSFFATVEPWHGSDVVLVPERMTGSADFGPRFQLDAEMIDGHALCVADIDGDGTDEVFAGYRGKGTSVNGYRLVDGEWQKKVIDAKIAAQDLRSGDMNGDGLRDVVSVGGSTKNVVLYQAVKR
jgi:hypothetical protein